MAKNYKAELEAAEKQMEELLREKMLLDLRIQQTSDTIKALTYLVTVEEPKLGDIPDTGELIGEAGITAAIRVLLSRSKLPLSPVQIREELMNHGFDLSDYANAMAVIHNTLKRLDRQGELMTVRNAAGQTVAYTTRWQADSAEHPLREIVKKPKSFGERIMDASKKK